MKKRTLFIVAAIFVQCLAMGWLIYRYERIVTDGVEVTFKCQAYDPYDPLRGRYLNVHVSESTTNICESIIKDFMNARCDYFNAYARIEEGTNGLWQVVRVASSPQQDGIWVKVRDNSMQYLLEYNDKKAGETWDDFKKRRMASGIKMSVNFPNQLFINERLAPKAEKLLNAATSSKDKEVIAVYRAYNGEIVISDIKIDGKSVRDIARQ
jgi:hypothetical protein